MVKMDLKFIKTSNRSSFLSIKLIFSGFQISFPMFLNNLLCKKTSYCNCNPHLICLCQECDILLLNENLLINFQKMLYQMNENVLLKSKYIKVSILFI